jgi:NADH-ubiquinone oxidoreductase chain 6
MNNLFILNEIFTNGYSVSIINILSIISVLCGIFVIVSKNPIVSVLFLIGLFLSISSYLIIIGISFIGLSYLLVYVGAVSILFIFILMLINIRVSELISDTSNSIPLAIIVSIAFNYTVYQSLPYSITSSNYTLDINNILLNIIYNNYKTNIVYIRTNDLINDELFFISSKMWDGNLTDNSHITSIGNIMYTSYSIWLILTSIILLLAMIGAIIITIKQKNI